MKKSQKAVIEKPRSQDELVSLVEKLTRTISTIESKFLKSFEENNISLRQLYYLETVAEEEEPTISAIAQKLEVTNPSVTIAVNNLIRKKLVQKKRASDDRRKCLIQLTKNGEYAVRMHYDAHVAFAKSIAKKLSDQDLKKFKTMLNTVLEQ